VVTPTVVVAVVQGTRAVGHKLIDMARAYGYRGRRILWLT
jgi:ABC-type nitrate/sulfonate/bicarbonate transport system permease component